MGRGHRAIRFNPRHVYQNVEAGDWSLPSASQGYYPSPMPVLNSLVFVGKLGRNQAHLFISFTQLKRDSVFLCEYSFLSSVF